MFLAGLTSNSAYVIVIRSFVRYGTDQHLTVAATLGVHGRNVGNFFRGGTMSFIAWIVLGLIAGFIASKLVNKTGEGVFLDIILGIIGAVVGGWLFNTFGMSGVSGVNLYSLLVAIVGAVIVLVAYHAIRRAA